MASKYFTLKEIEGVIVHDIYLKKEVERRAMAFEFLAQPKDAADYIGGELVPHPEIRCDWMIKKTFFPGAEVYFLYNRKDEELPASMQVLFAGAGVKEVCGEDLAVLAIATINHLIRYIRESNPGKELPDICSKV